MVSLLVLAVWGLLQVCAGLDIAGFALIKAMVFFLGLMQDVRGFGWGLHQLWLLVEYRLGWQWFRLQAGCLSGLKAMDFEMFFFCALGAYCFECFEFDIFLLSLRLCDFYIILCSLLAFLYILPWSKLWTGLQGLRFSLFVIFCYICSASLFLCALICCL